VKIELVINNVSIDKQDAKLLRALQDNSRISSQELADKAGMSAATCWRRIRAMEQRGVISGYSVQLDRQALGFEVCAFVHVSIEKRYSRVLDNIQTALRERPEILECYATTGDADFTLKVVSKSIEDYDRFLQKFLLELPEVGQVRSSIVLREISNTTDLPV